MAETAIAALRDPTGYPELAALQRALSGWRFHLGFRSDPASPLRAPQVASCAPVLDPDGANLAAVLATALHMGGAERVERAMADAFPGAWLTFEQALGRHMLAMRAPGQRRALSAAEMSDGTLQYLALVGALASLRRPPLVVLEEPEAGLNPALMPALARLVLEAAEDAQVILATHSAALVEALATEGAARVLALEKREGETVPARPRAAAAQV